MNRSTLYLLASATCVTAVLGCRDSNEPNGPRPPGLETKTAAHPPGGPRGDLDAIDQFALSVDLTGPLRPGSPVQIRAIARALLPSRAARVQIVVPDAASMRLARQLGHADRVPIGVPLPVEARTRQMMPTGAMVQQSARVIFNRPGYYRVMLIAEDVSGDDPLVNGRAVRNQMAKEVWVLITPAGGKVTQDYNPDLVPAGVPTQSGAFGKPVPNATCGTSCPPPCTGCGCGGCANNFVTFEALTQFTDSGSIVNQPLKMAKITVQTPSSTVNGVTDSQGRFRMNSCPSYPGTWTITIYNQNADVVVYKRVLLPLRTSVAVSGNINNTSCGKVVQYVSGLPESYVFVNAAIAAANGRTFFGRSRPILTYWLDHAPEAGQLADYSPGDDDIEMYTNDYLFSRGIFVAAHEYGHAFNEKALGGIRGGGCPSQHYIDSLSNFGCAFSEGFADYYAAATRGPEAAYYDRFDSPHAFSQGAASEQAVAAFYFDVTDPVGSGAEAAWDVIQYPGSYMAQLIETCEEFSGLSAITVGWNRARGVDAIIYCMERFLDPQVRTAYFFAGNDRLIYDFREGATEPGGTTQASDVRRAWLHNLYMQ
jgi:hypothetical protein